MDNMDVHSSWEAGKEAGREQKTGLELPGRQLLARDEDLRWLIGTLVPDTLTPHAVICLKSVQDQGSQYSLLEWKEFMSPHP